MFQIGNTSTHSEVDFPVSNVSFLGYCIPLGKPPHAAMPGEGEGEGK